MAQALTITGTLSARQFAEGLLAGLAAADFANIDANQAQLHKAFMRVLEEARKTKNLHVDFSEVDYDPLYGLSGWLDEFLARAQRDLMISCPNPSYQRIAIELTPEEGKRLLAQYSAQNAMEELSRLFIKELSD